MPITDWNGGNLNKRMEGMKDYPVVLYGAGKYGKQAMQNINKYFSFLDVKYYIDDNRVRNQGENIISLQEAIQKFGMDFYILIANYYVKEVLEKIEKAGFDLSKVLFCSELLIDDVNPQCLKEHDKDLKKVYEFLGDYKSKMIYRTMVESRFTKNIDVLCRTCDAIQYFPSDIWKMNDEEVFVDAGAYDGDTIEQFFKETDYKCKYIYAFEPDRTNYEKLKERQYGEHVKIYNAGLYETTKKISFSANKGGSSKIEEDGEHKVQVYQFDELELPDKAITFIKMDIEGSELKALEGMKQTIKKYKPKLAICIYHKFEDLWELPLYIKKLVPEYQLYIRNYTSYLDEIVLYAAI